MDCLDGVAGVTHDACLSAGTSGLKRKPQDDDDGDHHLSFSGPPVRRHPSEHERTRATHGFDSLRIKIY